MSQPVDTVSVAIKYETARSLRDFQLAVDAAAKKASGELKRAFEQVEQASAEAGASMGRSIDRGANAAESSLRGVESQARRSFSDVRREADKTGLAIGGKIGGALKGLAALGVTAAIGTGLSLLAVTGLKSAASLEQTEVAFASLMQSAEKGKQTLEGLKKFAALTPFELTDLTGVARRFLAFNDQVGLADDQLIEFLTTLGNIASIGGTGAFGMERVALAMGQIASTGRVQSDELLQIGDALGGAFSPIQAIAKGLGVSTAEATKMVENGAVNATDAIKFLLQGMKDFPGAAGAMEAQSKTLMGVFSTFSDTVNQQLAEAFQPVIPQIKDMVTEITPIIGSALAELGPAIGTGLIGILKLLAPLIAPLGKLLTALLQAAMPLFGLLAAIAVPVTEALVPIFEALEPVIAALIEPVAALLQAFAPLFPVLGMLIVAVVQIAAPLIKLLGILIGFLASKVLAPILEFLALGFYQIAGALQLFAQFLGEIDWGAVWHAIVEFFKMIGKAIGDFFSGTVNALKELPERAKTALIAFMLTVRTKLNDAVDFFINLPGRILSALAGFGKLLLNAGKDLIRGLFDGIASMGGWLMGKIQSFVSDFIVGPVKSFLGISSPSKVMADEVGAEIPAGIEQGAKASASSLDRLIGGLLMPTAAATEGLGMGGGALFGPGSIVVQFNGVVPSEAEATATGAAVGKGIADALRKRDARLTARTA